MHGETVEFNSSLL